MPIRFDCEQCGQTLSAPSRKAGDLIRCPACKEPTRIPVPEPAEEPVAAEPTPEPPPAPPEPEPATSPRDKGAERSAAGSAPTTRLAKPRGDDEEMDLTPMVDVVFLLLIFFMITASFSRQKSLEVPPPDPEKKGAQQSPDFLDDLEDISIRVTIDESDRVRVEDELVADLSGLGDLFADLMRREDKTELLLSPNDAARHETVVRVVDAAQDAGMERIRMTTGGGDDD